MKKNRYSSSYTANHRKIVTAVFTLLYNKKILHLKIKQMASGYKYAISVVTVNNINTSIAHAHTSNYYRKLYCKISPISLTTNPLYEKKTETVVVIQTASKH